MVILHFANEKLQQCSQLNVKGQQCIVVVCVNLNSVARNEKTHSNGNRVKPSSEYLHEGRWKHHLVDQLKNLAKNHPNSSKIQNLISNSVNQFSKQFRYIVSAFARLCLYGHKNSHFSKTPLQISSIFSSSKFRTILNSCNFYRFLHAFMHSFCVYFCCTSHFKCIFWPFIAHIFTLLRSFRFVSFHFLFCALLCIYGNPKCNNFSSSIFGVLVFLLQHISRFLINAYGNLCVRTRSQTFPYNVNLDKERSSGSFFLSIDILLAMRTLGNVCVERFVPSWPNDLLANFKHSSSEMDEAKWEHSLRNEMRNRFSHCILIVREKKLGTELNRRKWNDT